jgi:hypothetical protein
LREELEAHLDGYGPCKAFLASLEATIEDCRRFQNQAPDRYGEQTAEAAAAEEV